MKKLIALTLALVCVLSLFGCQADKPTTVSIKDNTTTVTVTHFHAAKEDKWNVEGEELNTIREWVDSLTYAEVEQPDVADGAQEYRFKATDNEFSYIINGENEHYLVVEDKWLAVSNPSHPPVVQPTN